MFKKIFSLFAALTLCAGLWAINNVPYIDAAGQSQTAKNALPRCAERYLEGEESMYAKRSLSSYQANFDEGKCFFLQFCK